MKEGIGEPVFTDLWDIFHPSDADDEEGLFPENGEWADLEDLPQVPSIDYIPPVVDYSTRAPGDFVISGPVGDARGNGRKYGSHFEAYKAACDKYGRARVSPVDAGEFRWAMLIKKA